MTEIQRQRIVGKTNFSIIIYRWIVIVLEHYITSRSKWRIIILVDTYEMFTYYLKSISSGFNRISKY